MVEDKTYNGWTNYETWNVNLWLSNDEGLYDETRRLARLAISDVDLADSLKTFVDELRPDLGASMFSDLLGAALSEVDWMEIAGHWTVED